MIKIIALSVLMWLVAYAIAFALVSPESRKASGAAKFGRRVASTVAVRNASRMVEKMWSRDRWN